MASVRDILDAIRNLPRPDRLRLFEELSSEIGTEPSRSAPRAPPPDSSLSVEDGFYVYTGAISDQSALDHRLLREERADRLALGVSGRRD